MTRQQASEIGQEQSWSAGQANRWQAPASSPARPARGRLLGLSWGGWTAVLVVAVAAILALAWGGLRSYTGGGPSTIPTAPVERGTLQVIVSADGTIRSDKTVDIKSEIEGMTRILEIVPESTRIQQPGEFLVRLDVSEIEKQRAGQEIKVKQSEAAVGLARRELEIQRAINASELNRAELNKTFAAIELEKYDLGEWPQQLQEAENAITIATEELQRARDKLEWSQKLAEQGYISGSELTADQLAVKKSELEVELARKKLEVLKKYTHPTELARRKSDLNEAIAELERTKSRAAAAEAKAVTDLDMKEQSSKLESEQLEKILRQIKASVINAPQPGLVVYASTGRNRRNNDDAIDVGYQVREGEAIITLPDLNVMVADVNVPEAKRSAIKEGQPATITIEAQPNDFLTGVVKSCGVLPVAQSWWRGGDVQQFQVVVNIQNPPHWLLPGLRCSAQVLVTQLDDVLRAPIQSVFLRGDQHFCYVAGPDGKVRAVPVWIGVDDDRMVEIKAGLQEGWQVLLAEPEDATSIQLEEPSFQKPVPVAAPRLQPSSRPDSQTPSSQPDGQADAETLRIISRIRERNPELADQLLKMTPEQRKAALAQMRSRRPRDGGGQGTSSGGQGGGDGQSRQRRSERP